MNPTGRLLILTATLSLLAGCAKAPRSISNSAHVEDKHHAYSNRSYVGELSEFDILGIDRNLFVTDEQIGAALNRSTDVRLRPSQRVLLIQSGATYPDPEMVSEIETHFQVIPFSGLPPQGMRDAKVERDKPGYSRAFRMAAARAGAEHIVCYWGSLESMREKIGTKTVSWVPVVGWMIPDENQAMRIQLKMAIIDVRSGAWTILAPEAFTDTSGFSNRYNRGRSDQKQVTGLKQQAYAQSVEKLANSYLR